MRGDRLRKIFVLVVLMIFFSVFIIHWDSHTALGIGVLPRALPDEGSYDSAQTVSLSSEAGASIYYTVYGRATVPQTLYTAPIFIEEDAVLSVDSVVGGVYAHKDFNYIISPKILSTTPGNGSVNVARAPTLEVLFSREMNEGVLENKSNISIRKSGGVTEVDPGFFTANYEPASNKLTLTIDSLHPLDAGTSYTVAFSGFVDSNGKSLQGSSSFSFTTVSAGGYATYGAIATDHSFYDNADPVDIVSISGMFIKDGLEVTDPALVPPLMINIYNPSGVLSYSTTVCALTNGRFTASYSIVTGCPQGTWTVKLFDNSTPRQLLNTCTYTVGSVAAPTADKAAGTYYEPVTVSLSTTTGGAAIYYTTNDSIPDSDVGSSCTLYQGAISVASTTTVRAVAIRGGVKSGLLSVTYTIDNTLGILTFTPSLMSGGVHETGVSCNTSVSVVFGRQVKSNTVINGFHLIELNDAHADLVGPYVDSTVTYDAVSRKATLWPSTPLKPLTHYRGVLESTIEDINGTNISPLLDDNWIFQTGLGQAIKVDGRDVYVDYIAVNKNPVSIAVTSPDAVVVTINGVQAQSLGGSQFGREITLAAGANRVTIVFTDAQSVSRTTTITVNYLQLLQVGAQVSMAIPDKGKMDLLNKQLLIELPKGSYLYNDSGPIQDQTLIFTVFRTAMPDGFPAVSYAYEIQPKTAGVSLNNKGQGKITFTFDKNVSSASSGCLTVLCDTNNDGVWDQNLGGKVDMKNKTIAVPFGYFGKYVVVNKVWSFSDFSTTGWAKTYVEYLWAKGIMKQLVGMPAGRFGLVDSIGNEMPITRGEFAVMMGKALGLNKIDYYEYGVFADLRISGSTGLARDTFGNWQVIEADDVKYLDMLAKNGVLNGSLDKYNQLVFNYFDNITREEVAVILARALSLQLETDDAKISAAITRLYTDAATSISVWAQSFVIAASKGYFGGFPDKTFRGQDSFTRPQAARIIYQTMLKAKLL